jgi:hypothetical protein
MSNGAWHDTVARLRSVGVQFEDGLTDAEVAAAESRFEFRFPPDLRELLQTALPSGEHFPNWRSGSVARLRRWLDIPRDGVVFDIEEYEFWLDEWGPRPADLRDAVREAERLIAASPKLIPVCMHRMMPDEPHVPGNPVFSVHQTDIIAYGHDLADYLDREFHLIDDESKRVQAEPRPIRFWDIDRFQNVRWRF